jgi:hypothetical protein
MGISSSWMSLFNVWMDGMDEAVSFLILNSVSHCCLNQKTSQELNVLLYPVSSNNYPAKDNSWLVLHYQTSKIQISSIAFLKLQIFFGYSDFLIFGLFLFFFLGLLMWG